VLNSTSDKEAKEQSDLTYLRTNLEMVSLRFPVTFFLNKDDERHERRDSGSDSILAFNHIQFSFSKNKITSSSYTQRCLEDKNHI